MDGIRERDEMLDPEAWKEGQTAEEIDSFLIKKLEHHFAIDESRGRYEIAKYLVEKYYLKTLGKRDREIFMYDKGVYVPGEDFVRKWIHDLLKDGCKTHTRNEILEKIKDMSVTERHLFVVDKNFINLDNGILDLKKRELLPHDPTYLFLTKIPITYDPSAKCPVINSYLIGVLDEDQMLLIQEWCGYLLYREYFIKKAVICVGDGDTGKTTLINLLCSFIGEDNLSSVSLQRITYDKFAAANLYNKHLNQYDDLSPKDIEDNGAFKMATGGGFIPGEKKFGDQFVFKNYAKLTFTCNKIPDVKDATDDAYFNRWIVIQFTRVIEEGKKDTQLIHKMTTPEELSGLLNFALEGLDRLLKNQRFSYDKETHDIKSEMMRSASSIACFTGDCLEEAMGEWISKEAMYRAYGDYTSEHKMPAVSTKKFGGRLQMCAPYVGEFRPVDPADPTGKRQITAWRNVKFRPTETS